MSLLKSECCPTCWEKYGRAIPLKDICEICGEKNAETKTEELEVIDI